MNEKEDIICGSIGCTLSVLLIVGAVMALRWWGNFCMENPPEPIQWNGIKPVVKWVWDGNKNED